MGRDQVSGIAVDWAVKVGILGADRTLGDKFQDLFDKQGAYFGTGTNIGGDQGFRTDKQKQMCLGIVSLTSLICQKGATTQRVRTENNLEYICM